MKIAAKAKRVLVVDDSSVMRMMIEGVLYESPYLEVVDLAAGAGEALAAIEELRPAIVIIDLCMPGVDGSGLLDMLGDYRGMHKIVLSSAKNLSDAMRRRLSESGALACYEKERVAKDPSWFRAELLGIADVPAISLAPWTGSAKPVAAAEASAVSNTTPAPIEESARLGALMPLEVANDDHDARLDIITRHLTRVTDYPFAAVTIIDATTQWTKSAIGVPRRPMARADAICARTIGHEGPLIVADTLEHPCFRTLPQVVHAPNVRAYVGVPVVGRGGAHLGAVCLLDRKPRHVVQGEVMILNDMAQIVAELLSCARAPTAA